MKPEITIQKKTINNRNNSIFNHQIKIILNYSLKNLNDKICLIIDKYSPNITILENLESKQYFFIYIKPNYRYNEDKDNNNQDLLSILINSINCD